MNEPMHLTQLSEPHDSDHPDSSHADSEEGVSVSTDDNPNDSNPTQPSGLQTHHLISAALTLEQSPSLTEGLDIARTRQIKRSLRSKELEVDPNATIHDQVLQILEQGPGTMSQLSSVLKIRPLALRPELREMEEQGLIELNGDRYMLGPRWIAANPIGPVAHSLLLSNLRVGNVVAEADIISRTNLSPETVRRGMRWMERLGEISIRYVGQKAIYDPKVGAPTPLTAHPPRIGEKVPTQKPKTLWFQRSVDKG